MCGCCVDVCGSETCTHPAGSCLVSRDDGIAMGVWLGKPLGGEDTCGGSALSVCCFTS